MSETSRYAREASFSLHPTVDAVLCLRNVRERQASPIYCASTLMIVMCRLLC